MRVFWGVMLAGGLLLIGLDVYDSRRSGREPGPRQPVATMEDGTGVPPPNPPPR